MSESLQGYGLYIDGESTPSASGQTFTSFDPFRGKDWAELALAGDQDVHRAVLSARRALFHGAWPDTTGVQRAHLLRRLAALIRENARELATAEVRDNGKLYREMNAQMNGLIPEFFEYYAGEADRIEGRVVPTGKPDYLTYLVQEPIGVVAAITAWNSPTLLMAYKLAPAIAAGCTFVLKPSEVASVSSLLFAQITAEAGLPPGVFNVLTGDGLVGAALASHPAVDKVAFTGSTAVGRKVAAAAAGHLAPVSLELGGKSAQVVFPDADLAATANGVVAGIFAACGQTCVAGSRLLVHTDVQDELVARIVDRASTMVLGDPMDPDTEMGPLSFPGHFERVLSFIASGIQEGAKLVTGGGQWPGAGGGLFVEPTVFTEVTSDMTVSREEIFGPVLAVTSFETEDEACDLANGSDFGLAAGLWTNDIRRAHRVAHRLRTGTVWVNGYRVVAAEVPFGGVGASGYGREGGHEGLREYLRTKSVWIELSGQTRDPFAIG